MLGVMGCLRFEVFSEVLKQSGDKQQRVECVRHPSEGVQPHSTHFLMPVKDKKE